MLYGFEMRDFDDRRSDPGERKTYNIKQLWQRNHEILRLAVLGYKSAQIATLLGITPETVSNTLNSDLGMEKLSVLRQERDKKTVDVVEEVNKLMPKALATYEKILDDEKESAKLKKEVADTVLMDIGGHRAPAKVQGQFAHAHLIKEEIDKLKQRGIEAARESGMLIEYHPEEHNDSEAEAS